jgi:hypothetical protein
VDPTAETREITARVSDMVLGHNRRVRTCVGLTKGVYHGGQRTKDSPLPQRRAVHAVAAELWRAGVPYPKDLQMYASSDNGK